MEASFSKDSKDNGEVKMKSFEIGNYYNTLLLLDLFCSTPSGLK
jgi:hypothetical protein